MPKLIRWARGDHFHLSDPTTLPPPIARHLCFLWCRRLSLLSPTSFRKNGLSQSKDSPSEGGFWSLSRYRGVAWTSIARMVQEPFFQEPKDDPEPPQPFFQNRNRAFLLKLSWPWSSFPCFSGIPCFLLLHGIPCFFECFSLLSQGF